MCGGLPVCLFMSVCVVERLSIGESGYQEEGILWQIGVGERNHGGELVLGRTGTGKNGQWAE